MFATTLKLLKKRFPTAPLLLHQANKRRRAPQVNHNFAVRIPLRKLKQTRFCWPFNNRLRTPIQPLSITTSAKSRNCLNPSQRHFPRLMKNQRKSIESRSIPDKFGNPQSADGRRQNKLLPLSHEWCCSTDFQKHH